MAKYTNKEAEYRNAVQILMASPNWKSLRNSRTTKELIYSLENLKDKTIFDTRALEILKNIEEENKMGGIKRFVNEMLEPILSEIERDQMPQVRGKDIPEMLKIFDDNNILYKKGVIKCKLLKPVQEDFIPEKKESIINSLSNGNPLNPIVVSRDGYIMDGHHRWLAVKELWGDSYKIPVIQILLPKIEALRLFDKVSDKISEEIITEKVNKVIAVYPGRFQPFHSGHYYAYEYLVRKFGKDNVYITTSNKTGADSPFDFDDKKKIMTKMFGIPSSHIIQSRNPYNPVELESKLKGNALVYAIGEKDSDRMPGAILYRQGVELEPVPTYYSIFVPQLQMKVGNYIISGTVIRNVFKTNSDKAKKELFNRLYGRFDKEIFELFNKKIVAEIVDEQPIQERINIDSEKQLLRDIIHSNESLDIRELLLCGGAHGHISHPFDDWQLTFGDLRQIIENALQGNLELAKEKCIDGDSIITLEKAGNISIKNVVENKIEDKVLSYNIEKDELGYADIIDYANNGYTNDWIEIEMETGEKLLVTPNHRIYVEGIGYLRAENLSDDMLLRIK